MVDFDVNIVLNGAAAQGAIANIDGALKQVERQTNTTNLAFKNYAGTAQTEIEKLGRQIEWSTRVFGSFTQQTELGFITLTNSAQRFMEKIENITTAAQRMSRAIAQGVTSNVLGQFAGQTLQGTAENYARSMVANLTGGDPRSLNVQRAAGYYLQGGIGPKGPNQYGPHFDIAKTDSGYFPRGALDQWVMVNGKPISEGLTVRGGQFGASRDGGSRVHRAWDYAFAGQAKLTLTNGATWVGNPDTNGKYGDNSVFRLPNGQQFRIIHGQFVADGSSSGRPSSSSSSASSASAAMAGASNDGGLAPWQIQRELESLNGAYERIIEKNAELKAQTSALSSGIEGYGTGETSWERDTKLIEAQSDAEKLLAERKVRLNEAVEMGALSQTQATEEFKKYEVAVKENLELTEKQIDLTTKLADVRKLIGDIQRRSQALDGEARSREVGNAVLQKEIDLYTSGFEVRDRDVALIRATGESTEFIVEAKEKLQAAVTDELISAELATSQYQALNEKVRANLRLTEEQIRLAEVRQGLEDFNQGRDAFASRLSGMRDDNSWAEFELNQSTLTGFGTEATERAIAVSAAWKEAQDYLSEGLDLINQIYDASKDASGQATISMQVYGDMVAKVNMESEQLFQTMLEGIDVQAATAQASEEASAALARQQELVNLLTNEFTQMSIDVISGAENIVTAMGRVLESVLTLFANQAFNSIFGSLFSGLLPNADGNVLRGGFQAFANGGIVNKPTLGLVGEGTMNEAIVPLPDGRSIPVEMRGGGGMTVNIKVENPGSETDGRRLGKQISEAIKSELVAQSRVGGLLRR